MASSSFMLRHVLPRVLRMFMLATKPRKHFSLMAKMSELLKAADSLAK